jgi:hypothetical protein
MRGYHGARQKWYGWTTWHSHTRIMIKHDMKFINIIYHNIIQKIARWVYKITKLLWTRCLAYHGLYTNMTQEQSMQQVYKWVKGRKGKLTIHVYKGFQEPFKAGWRTIISWSPHGQKIKYHQAHVRVSIPTHKETKKTESWIPKD